MADRIIEKETVDEPRETVVVREREPRDQPAHMSVGWIVLIIILVLVVLFLIFGRGFGGGGSGTNVNVPTPTPTPTSQ